MSLGQRLYDLRKTTGLSQEKAAEQLGVTRQTVSKWETDHFFVIIAVATMLIVFGAIACQIAKLVFSLKGIEIDE